MTELRAAVQRREPGQQAQTRALIIHLERGGALPEQRAEGDSAAALTSAAARRHFSAGDRRAAAQIVGASPHDAPQHGGPRLSLKEANMALG